MLAIVISLGAIAEEQHHNLSISLCRAFPNGDIQISGISEVDNQERSLIYTTSMFQEKVMDRYLSLCITAYASGSKFRADYLACTGTTCTPKINTTVMLRK